MSTADGTANTYRGTGEGFFGGSIATHGGGGGGTGFDPLDPVAIGTGTHASNGGPGSVTIGATATTRTAADVSVGSGAQVLASGQVAVCIGNDSRVDGNGGVAVGGNAQATAAGGGAIAVGLDSVGNATDSVAIGRAASSAGVANAVCLGEGAFPGDAAHSALCLGTIQATALTVGAPALAATHELGVTINGVTYRLALYAP